jgi:hypothetical protein
LGTKHKDNFEPYWQDEKDWLYNVEFLPTDNPEARLFAAEIIGYRFRVFGRPTFKRNWSAHSPKVGGADFGK